MIRNTATQSPTLMDVMPGMIEASEAQGQVELVNSTQLPVDGSKRPEVVALGIEFGDPTPGDELFCDAELPTGWKKRPTDHSMWSEIVDENDVIKARIFYKAAFYDRRAFITSA